MIGGAPHIPIRRREVPDGSVTPLDTPFNRKIHKEYASAMAKQRPDDTIVLGRKPYPIACTLEEGGPWKAPAAVKFSDDSIYDNVIHKWRKLTDDPILDWDRVCAGDPLASNTMLLAGNRLANEVKNLRAKLLDLEQERRAHASSLPMFEDEERDF